MSPRSLPVRGSIVPLLGAICLLSCSSGCGDGKFPIRPAKGKVVCEGQPVTVGSVTFSPIGEAEGLEVGKSATAAVGPDGTFVLSTHGRFDGAVVGKHRVQYVGPEGEEEGSEDENSAAPAEGSKEEFEKEIKRLREKRSRPKLRCVQPGEMIVEVKADGENDFTIELTKALPEE